MAQLRLPERKAVSDFPPLIGEMMTLPKSMPTRGVMFFMFFMTNMYDSHHFLKTIMFLYVIVLNYNVVVNFLDDGL